MKTLLFIIISILTFNCSKKEEVNLNCENLIKIDSLSFIKNKKIPLNFAQKSVLKKENNEIKIQHLNHTFKDNLTDENFMEYSIVGKFKKWNLILGQDYNQNYYYLVDKNKIDTLVGPPRVFENTILSIEEAHTDFQEKIEIWNIQESGKIILNKNFSLKKCYDFRIMESYLFEKYLYLKTGVENRKSQFYKIKYK
ncbi:hypothetical protein GCM10011508_23100 [Flavobacterium lutivivi]|nr:hypothetical protein GCM10011508_23100 [Flavobacterium lutivivi]